jgi:photosystem II stability/assembly factor-like uncharacterized protein
MRQIVGALALAGACFALSACGGGSGAAGGSTSGPADGPPGVDCVAGWCRQDSAATDGSVRSIRFADASNGVVLLADGALAHTSDGGRHWTTRPGVGAATGWGDPMRFAATGLGWAFLGDTLQRSTDAGRSWSPLVTPAAASSPAEAFDLQADGLHGWLVSGGRVWATADAGASWRVAGAAPVPLCQCELRFRDLGTGLLASLYGEAWRTTDGGATWVALALPAGSVVHAIAWASPQVAWMVGSGGGASGTLRSDDGGASWIRVDLGVADPLQDVRFVDAQHGWIVGNGVALRTDDGGATWQRQDLGGTAVERAFFLDASTGWVGGDDGRILATVTGGR